MKKRKIRWGWIVLALIVCAITTVLYVQSRPTRSVPKDAGVAGSAITFPVTRDDLSNTLEVKGKSSYVKETMIYAPFTADVKEWKVESGAQVKKGDVLFVLNDEPLANSIAQLQAQLQKQELEERLRKLDAPENNSAKSMLSETEKEALARLAEEETRRVQQELDRVNNEIARKQLAEKENQRRQSAFVAPEDDIFLFSDVKEPKTVTENELLGKIVDLSQLQLNSTVGEYDVFHIQPGMPVDVRIDALRQTSLKGTVSYVSKFAKADSEKSSSTTQFELTMTLEPHEKLIAGLSLTGSIVTESRENALAVPSLAVYKERDDAYVYVQTADGATERKSIRIGMETADKTEVLEGLQEGDIVVLQ